MAALKRPTLPLTGRCPCGQVRFDVSAMPLLLYACHCTECQRWSGSAFSLSMPVAARHFRITAGEAKPWRRVSSSGARTSSWFCGNCGGRIYGERESRPGVVVLRAGTLDDTSWLQPVAHLFMRSAQPWEQVSGEAECFETLPQDFRPLADTWQRLWQT